MKICIDPGHGMSNRSPGVYDPGAINPITKETEADIALLWGLTLKAKLVEAGIPVFMTRDDEGDHTPVGSRVAKAVQHGCTHFISLHCNAGPSTATGCEVFYRDDADGADDKSWASKALSAVVNATGLRDRGLKTESQSQHSRLAVLGFVGASCLVEIGFIGKDIRALRSRDVRIKFAEELIKGIRAR